MVGRGRVGLAFVFTRASLSNELSDLADDAGRRRDEDASSYAPDEYR